LGELQIQGQPYQLGRFHRGTAAKGTGEGSQKKGEDCQESLDFSQQGKAAS